MAERKSLKDHAMELARQVWGDGWRTSHLKPLGPAFAALAADVPAPDVEMFWYVLLTEPMREKVAAARLNVLGFKPYLPVFVQMQKYTVTTMLTKVQKTRPVEKPLFPGYLFVPMPVVSSRAPGFSAPFSEEQFGTQTYAGRSFGKAFSELYRVSGLRTGERSNTSPFLKINGEFATVSEAEMETIRSVVHSKENPENHGLPYKVGDEVRILSGAFADALGEVVSLDDEQRIMLLIDFLGRKTKTRVNSRQITAA